MAPSASDFTLRTSQLSRQRTGYIPALWHSLRPP
jgi:hypothetical protein